MAAGVPERGRDQVVVKQLNVETDFVGHDDTVWHPNDTDFAFGYTETCSAWAISI